MIPGPWPAAKLQIPELCLTPSRDGDALEAFNASWGKAPPVRRPEGWDGRAAERVADAVEEWAGRK
ncbi:MAG: hypothetical protein Q8N53_03180 [Longimicrobiales bacterium]|nr:hypothetical protein [Longimicrobiales bacterium]